MGSRKMTRRRRELRREQAEARDYLHKCWRRPKDEPVPESIAGKPSRMDRNDPITRKAIEDVFDGSWADWYFLPSEALERLITTISGADFEYREKLHELLATVARKAPGLIKHDRIYSYISMAREDFINAPSSWAPRSRSKRKKARSLIDHLLVKYPVPEFLYQLVDVKPKGFDGVPFFASVASGARMIDCFNGGHLPVPMTRKMCHHFMQMPSQAGFFGAVRRAQVRALGGGAELEGALQATPLGRGLQDDEDFWFTVIRWFCGQPDLRVDQVNPLIDYIRQEWERDHKFSMKGRTVKALTVRMEEWHRQLRDAERYAGKKFVPSGIRGGYWDVGSKKSRTSGTSRWTISEVLSGDELLEEGRSMRHCVYSYGFAIQQRGTSIWSLRKEKERALTVQVMNDSKKIVQARGKCNRPARKIELQLLQRWARESDLCLSL